MKDKLLKILKPSTHIDWFIVHKLSKEKFDNIKFSFVDGKERFDYPFKTNLGYITFKNESFLDKYHTIIKDIIIESKDNAFALANIYIIITRTSFQKEDEDILEKLFKKEINKESIKSIYKLLVKSLNENYYSHLHNKINTYKTLNDWLEIFNSAQYLHDTSDTLFSILFLVEVDSLKKIEYEKIKEFNPLIRGHLISWYGTNIKISEDELIKLINDNSEEASFFAALLIENSSLPDWINKKTLDIFIIKYWNSIGKDLFLHLFGISYINKGKDFSELKAIIHSILFNKIKSENDFNKNWFNSLDFPNDFIALFSWIHHNKITLENIDNNNKKLIANSLMNSLNGIADNFKKYIASENDYFPFKSHQLNEEKYHTSLSYILLFITTLDEADFKIIKKEFNSLAFKIRPQYYGAYRSQYLAMNFTEILLLILLSAINISNISENIIINTKHLLKILNKTILIPYIHLTERNEEIWNKETEKSRFQYKIGEYLINDYLKKIKKNENGLHEHFKDLFELFGNVKVAEWLYER